MSVLRNHHPRLIMRIFVGLVVAAVVAVVAASAYAQPATPDGYRPAREVLGDASALDPNRPATAPAQTPPQAPAKGEASVVPTADGVAPSEEPAEASAPAVELPPAGVAVGEGDSVIRVTVRGRVGDAYDAPIPNQRVELTTIVPPHSVIQRLDAVTGDDGIATFQVVSGQGIQAFARAFRDGREVFAANGTALDLAGEFQMTVQDMPVVDDPKVVFASRVITIAEVWEDYLVFTQIFMLATDQPVVFKASGEGRAAGLMIPLPEGAVGVRVIQPSDQAEVAGEAVMFRGEIQPAGAGEPKPTLILRYSVKHANARAVTWSQQFAFDVENLSLVVPQQSEHPRHPHLDVAIDVPFCEDSVNPMVMCFNDISDSAEGVQMLQGKAVRVARGGMVRAGGTMTITTSGWPSDPHIARWASAAALLLALVLGFTLILRTRRGRTAPEDTRTRLQLAREKLLERTEALELAYLSGSVLEVEYDAEQELIVGELALIERRLRELGAGASPAPTASIDRADEPVHG